MEKAVRKKPGPKPDPNKLRTTTVSAYLSERRKAALDELSRKIDNGIMAVLVTNAIEAVYGQQLDNIESTINMPTDCRKR